MTSLPAILPDDPAVSLTMAIVEAAPGLLLLLGGDLAIIGASASFGKAFDLDPAAIKGRQVSSLGAGEWASPRLRSLLEATLAGAAKTPDYEMDLQRVGRDTRALIIHAERLVYQDLDSPRLMVAVCDVTEARADRKGLEEAVRRSAVLVREVRHRVANSLHLIATVLLQSARKTQSEQVRSQLKDAHDRVMSVATLEHQLSESGDGKVDMRAYISRLCDTIDDSLIGDRDLITLAVSGPGGVVDARVSVSLGLIVTELVINAVKHAFPEGRRGRIMVDCAFPGPNWRLTVTDDGVGMPTGDGVIHTGVGATIVRALVQELGAAVTIEPAHSGTRVTVARTLIALVDEADALAPERPAVDRPAASLGAN